MSVKRDFILGPLSLGGYFGTASLQYDYLNTTGTVSSVTQAGRFSHLPFKAYFHSYFLFCLLFLSVFTAAILFSQSCIALLSRLLTLAAHCREK